MPALTRKAVEWIAGRKDASPPFFTYRDHYAIRRDQWLLIDAPPGAVSNVPAWFDEANGYTPDGHPAALYDLREDLSQRHNLFAAYPGLVDELREELRGIRERGTSVSR